MPDPTTLERFARALQGFGAGVQGRNPAYMEEDLARERMRQQEGQFQQTLSLQQEQFRES
mgnify:FL=1